VAGAITTSRRRSGSSTRQPTTITPINNPAIPGANLELEQSVD
jgi:hypothetical protein